MNERVLYITNLPTPYRLPLYRRLGEMLGARGGRLQLFFLGYAKSDRRWKIDDEEMRGIEFTLNERGNAFAMNDAVRAIDTFGPSAVVLAWAMDQVALRLLLHCRRRGIPCIVVSGETPHSAANNPHAWLRGRFRLAFFKLASRFVTYGSASTEYLLSAGVEAARITTGVNVVDTGYFAGEVDRLRAAGAARDERARYRNSNGDEFGTHVLFVGYLLPEKGAHHALEMLAESAGNIALHIVGAGPAEEFLRERIRELDLGGRVFMHGYRQQRELPMYYALADMLIFPSTLEVFGLVMVEALAAGLPILASQFAGGTPDIVEHGANGFVVDPAQPAAMARLVARLADDTALRRRMGAESRRRALEQFTIERSAGFYVEALDRCDVSRPADRV